MNERDFLKIERLAEIIYDEVCRVFNERTGGNSQTHCPFALQGEAIRQSYIRGAVAAHTTMINWMVQEMSNE